MNKFVKGFFSLIKLTLIKLFNFNAIFFAIKEDIDLSAKIIIKKNSKMFLGESVHIRDHAIVKCSKGAEILIGSHTSIGRNNNIVAHSRIEIGNYCDLGPNVCIYDHDHDYKVVDGLKAEKYTVNPIIIGNNVWIGANATILRGSIIGDNCVIGAGTVIKGCIEKNTLVYSDVNLKKIGI